MVSERSDKSLVEFLQNSNQILIFSGAGISTGSGIPDYRGPQGVWTRRQPVYYQDFMTSEAARIEYWDYKLEGWEGFRNAEPNAVHHACSKLEEANKLCMVVTQNIDGLHSQAGTSREKLVEVHGTNLETECQTCLERTEPGPHFEEFKKTQQAPLCHCGGYLKPATISFGQSLREEDLHRANEAAEKTDLVIALGSTLSVHPAASVPLMAANRGSPYVIINRGETDQDNHPAVSLRLEGDVVEIFPPAVEAAIK
ncbi:Sir2 family NAD-dependent protein deacetylase [candidate division KSB1 bacterium]|nr:Sir2 family NAD-dependent protein deacetylase [candidate division KSB1 bacterium]